MDDPGEPVGVVLAGGRGQRLGGAKAFAELDGRPLLAYPVAAMRGVLRDVVLLVKIDTELAIAPGVAVWRERARDHHPLLGIVSALELASGRPVLVCACDLPFVSRELIRRLAVVPGPGAPAVVAARAGSLQPLLGCYAPRALGPLRAAAAAGARSVDAVASLGPALVEVQDAEELFNINTLGDLRQARARLAARRGG